MPQTADDIRFNVSCAAIYHGEMAVFCRRLEMSIIWLIIALSTTSASGVVTHLHLPREYLDLGVAALAALQIAFRYGDRALLHEKVAHDCCEILGGIEARAQIRNADLFDWGARFARIRAADGMQMRAMAAVAFNEALEFCIPDIATRRKHRKRVKWLHRVLRHVCPFKGTDFDPR